VAGLDGDARTPDLSAEPGHAVAGYAGIADRADGDGQSNPLQERKVDVDVEPLRLEAGETVGDGLERLTDRVEMVQPFLKTEVGEVVGAEFVAQESRELLILLVLGQPRKSNDHNGMMAPPWALATA
jgi:hypothetical protein